MGRVAATLLAMELAAGCGPSGPTATRGQYLVDTVGACSYCHTPFVNGRFDETRKLGGTLDRFDLGATGKLSAPNLTPDATGLRDWTDDQIKRAIRQGYRRGGEVMWWVMGYFEAANYTDEDVDSIILYLRSLPPIDNAVPRLPYTARTTPYLPVTGDAIPQPMLPPGDPDYSRAQHGRYLASVGCVSCHTPFGSGDFRRDPTRVFAGGLEFSIIPPFQNQKVVTANLTPHANGLTLAPTAIAATLKRTGTALCGPMNLMVSAFYSQLTDDDALAIAVYLKNIPPVDTGVIPNCTP